MPVVADQARLRRRGRCAVEAPGVFDERRDEDGIVVVLDERPPPEE